MTSMRRCLWAGLLVGPLCIPPASAANRFFINNQELLLGDEDKEVKVLADVDQDTYGFSVSLQYDATKISVTAVQVGAAVTPLSPEYNHGTLTPSPGRIVHGVVFDMSSPITKKLPSGTAKELLILTVDVTASTETTAVLDFVNAPEPPPARVNVLTNANGESISPALQDGTLTLRRPAIPFIESFLGNTGCPGKEFFVVGQNFNGPNFRVEMFCGGSWGAVAAELLGDQQTVKVTAPGCGGATGWVPLRVCTDLGCDEEPQAFSYDTGCGEPPQTFIRGDANKDNRVDLSDGVAILNDRFLGIPAAALCEDALDVNDNGAIDISDAIYCLNFLFLGGSVIPPPYPAAGEDPTADGLADCRAP